MVIDEVAGELFMTPSLPGILGSVQCISYLKHNLTSLARVKHPQPWRRFVSLGLGEIPPCHQQCHKRSSKPPVCLLSRLHLDVKSAYRGLRRSIEPASSLPSLLSQTDPLPVSGWLWVAGCWLSSGGCSAPRASRKNRGGMLTACNQQLPTANCQLPSAYCFW